MKNSGNIIEWWMRRFIVLVALILFLLVPFSHSFASCPSLKNNQLTSSENPEDIKKTNHNFYLRAKVGLVYVFGVELEYIIQTREINRFYLATSIQSSIIVNSFNAGGGFFLGKSGIGLGCRYHHLLWFESEKGSKIQPGYGPEVIWNKTIGTKYIINLHAGGIITKGSFFPDISFGVFLPLNR